jgi:hypothetical protein
LATDRITSAALRMMSPTGVVAGLRLRVPFLRAPLVTAVALLAPFFFEICYAFMNPSCTDKGLGVPVNVE